MGRRFFEILVTGSEGGGKTSLINRLTNDSFSEEHVPTKFLDQYPHKTNIDGNEITFILTDTDAQKNYEGYSINYYTKMDAVIVIYDLSNQHSMEIVKEIAEDINKYCKRDNKTAITVLVGNKSDKEREVNKQDAMDFAEKEHMGYIETSAKTNTNIKLAFETLAKRIVEKYGNPEPSATRRDSEQSRLSTIIYNAKGERMEQNCCSVQ